MPPSPQPTPPPPGTGAGLTLRPFSPQNPADQRRHPEPHLQQQWGCQPVSAWGGAGPGWGAAGRRSRVPHLGPGSPRKPNTLKQKNGFPPNFIHSLDSSHMMLTALHCYRWAPRGRSPPTAGRACSGCWGHDGDPHSVGDSEVRFCRREPQPRESVGPAVSRELCRCTQRPWVDLEGRDGSSECKIKLAPGGSCGPPICPSAQVSVGMHC